MVKEKYIDSGVDWFGEIPRDWNIKRIKYVIDRVGSGGTPESSNEEFYSDTGIPWVAIGDMSSSNYVYDTYKKVTKLGIADKQLNVYPKGTILYSIYATIGKVSELACEATINQAILAIKENNKIVDKEFFKLFLQSIEDCVSSEGSTNTQTNLNLQKVLNFPIVLPKLDEQKKIAKILMNKCKNIDLLISNTENQLDKLRKQRITTITEMVTHGHSSDIEMVNIPWVKSKPKTWKITRLKYVSTLKGRIGWQGLTSDEYQDEGPYLITGVDFVNGRIDWDNCVHISEERWKEAPDIQIQNNDLLITKDGTIGKVAIVDNLNDKASLNSGVMLINLNRNEDKRFLYWLIQSNVFITWFSYNNPGNSTIEHLYQNAFENFYYARPEIKEQKEIAKQLDKKISIIDKIIDIKQKEYQDLLCYKKSLLFEYITGKKRV